MAASNAERPRKRSRSRRDETTTYLPIPPRPTHEPSLSEVRNGQRAHEIESSHAIRQTEDTGIRIDYSQTVFDMCAQVLSHVIKTTESLDIICFRWAPSPRERGMEANPPRETGEPPHPTWLLHSQRSVYTATSRSQFSTAARIVNRVSADPLVGQPGWKRRPYLACGRTQAKPSEAYIKDRILHAGGWPLAVVKDLGSPALDAVIPYNWRQKLGWTNLEELLPDRFWRTLVGNRSLDVLGGEVPARFKLACRWAFERGCTDQSNCNLGRVRDDGDREAPLKEFLDAAIRTVWDRRLILSKPCNGGPEKCCLAGLGPTDTKEGDIVCILSGCAVPVVLRPKIVAQDCSVPIIGVNAHILGTVISDFEFIGECYVDGMMNGECFYYLDDHNIGYQDFRLH